MCLSEGGGKGYNCMCLSGDGAKGIIVCAYRRMVAKGIIIICAYLRMVQKDVIIISMCLSEDAREGWAMCRGGG